MASIQRRKSVTVKIGNVHVGSDAPLVVQSMTNTDTADVQGTIQQCAQLAQAGSELVRVTMEAMVVSALRSAELAEQFGLPHNFIILSAKVSGVQDLIDVYRSLAARCDYALHLGLT